MATVEGNSFKFETEDIEFRFASPNSLHLYINGDFRVGMLRDLTWGKLLEFLQRVYVEVSPKQVTVDLARIEALEKELAELKSQAK